jgi:hypothetical protein
MRLAAWLCAGMTGVLGTVVVHFQQAREEAWAKNGVNTLGAGLHAATMPQFCPMLKSLFPKTPTGRT